MLDLNQEQELIVSSLVNQAIVEVEDELFYYDLDPVVNDVEQDMLEALEEELLLLEDLRIQLEDNIYAEEPV